MLDKHLKGKTWVCGDEYSIAEMAIYPGVEREFLIDNLLV